MLHYTKYCKVHMSYLASLRIYKVMKYEYCFTVLFRILDKVVLGVKLFKKDVIFNEMYFILGWWWLVLAYLSNRLSVIKLRSGHTNNILQHS